MSISGPAGEIRCELLTGLSGHHGCALAAMMRPAIQAAALVLFLQCALCEQPKVVEKSPPPASVSGRVVAAADSAPLKSARLVLAPERPGTGSIQARSAMSDAEGKFKIEGIHAGRYRFFASRNGYVDEQFRSAGAEKGAILALKPGEEFNDVLFRMNPAAVVTGRIDDEDGQPMAKIQVLALKRPSQEEKEDDPWLQHRELSAAAAGETDDRGRYRLFGLKPGEYYIRAIDQFMPTGVMMGVSSEDWAVQESLGPQYAPVYYPGSTQLGQAQAVLVRPGEEAEADFVLRRVKTVAVSGKVIGFDGKPATSAYVGLIETPASESSPSLNAEPDNKGEFKIGSVPPGSYLLMANQESEGRWYHAQMKIDLDDENTESVTLLLGRGTTISGRVSVTSGTLNMDRLYVSLVPPDEFIPGGTSQVKRDGSFEIADVPDGNFMFEVRGLEEGYYIRSARFGRDNVLTNGLQVEKGETAGAIQVVVGQSTAQLEGVVTQKEVAMAAIRVRAIPQPETQFNRGRARSTMTDQSGHFSFPAIAPGTYKVIAKFSGLDGGKPAVSDPQTIDISEGEHRQMEITIVPPEK